MPGVLEAAGLAAWQGSAGQGANVPQAVAVVPTRRWCSRPGVLEAAGGAGQTWQTGWDRLGAGLVSGGLEVDW